MRIPILPLLFSGLVAGCAGDAATAMAPPAPDLAAAGSSGCYAVSGEIAQPGAFPKFAGTISGDIVGTVTTQIDVASERIAGRVRLTTAEQTWEVTSGNVPELIGRTVELALENRIVYAQPPVGRNNTRSTVVAGARKGNLTYYGRVDATGSHVEYRGVICP